jgi:hypothetical protein
VQRVSKKALQRFAADAVATGRTISQRLGYDAARRSTAITHGLKVPEDLPT